MANGGSDFQAFITPWLIKTTVCAAIGGVAGYLYPRLVSTSSR